MRDAISNIRRLVHHELFDQSIGEALMFALLALIIVGLAVFSVMMLVVGIAGIGTMGATLFFPFFLAVGCGIASATLGYGVYCNR